MKALGLILLSLSLCLGAAVKAEDADQPSATEAGSADVERATDKNCNCKVDDNQTLTRNRAEDLQRADTDLAGSNKKHSGGSGAVSEPTSSDPNN